LSSGQQRERLAAAQAGLVCALVAGAPPPAGFDAHRIEVAAAALLRKRARQVRRAWPALTASLGPAFDRRFATFAADHPPPLTGGGVADGLALADVLAAEGALHGEAAVERLLMRARWRATPAGAVARRGPFAGVVVAGRPRRLVAAFRAPGLGPRHVTLPARRATGL
jgi:hypothetical protein